jgi:spoIIIJ-associated protein
MLNQNAESLDVSAKTVDEAIEDGLAQLNLERDQVDIVILREGKRGVFGLGAEDALVRLTPRKQGVPARETPKPAVKQPVPPVSDSVKEEAPSSPEPITAEEEPPARASQTPPQQQPVASREESPVVSGEEESPDGESEENVVEQLAVNYLSDMLALMGIEAEITPRMGTDLVDPGEEPPLTLNITGKDLGVLIGRRSETLRALQYMLRLMVSKDMKSWQPIVVDVESYRVRRRRSLRRMAQRMAERAVTSQKRVVLESMPAYERRLIHVALKDHPAVFTKSVGSDENRKVTIIPK